VVFLVVTGPDDRDEAQRVSVALKWFDIDWHRGTASVRQQYRLLERSGPSTTRSGSGAAASLSCRILFSKPFRNYERSKKARGKGVGPRNMS
jgi:hypothetical protein